MSFNDAASININGVTNEGYDGQNAILYRSQAV